MARRREPHGRGCSRLDYRIRRVWPRPRAVRRLRGGRASADGRPTVHGELQGQRGRKDVGGGRADQ